jgi:N-methylhydantoinase A
VREGRPPRSFESFSFTAAERLPFALVDRHGLGVGDRLDGPAIVVEETATTYLDAGWAAEVDASGCLVITDAR